jgi:hypothetical protein
MRAKWAPVKTSSKTELVVTPFEKPITKTDQSAVAEEGLRLLEFLAPDEKRDVRFAAVQR